MTTGISTGKMSFGTYPFAGIEGDEHSKVLTNEEGYVLPPKRALNGGLYTGEKFVEGAPWGNYPAVPDVDYMTHVNLRTANPPDAAVYHYVGNTRPGNNYNALTGHQVFTNPKMTDLPYNITCIPSTYKKPKTMCSCHRFAPISGNDFEDGICRCGQKIVIQVD
jgi:hypothetical protein